ncbi:MAG: aldehyde dehydrogenase family protein [Vicinamibacterales bacterium]
MSASFNGRARVATPVNEPIKAYAPGSPERASLETALNRMAGEQVDIPIVIGGREIRTGNTATSVMPHDHRHVLGTWHKATPELAHEAIAAAKAAHKEWAGWAFEDRAAVSSQGGGTVAHLMARRHQRRHHAQSEQDGLPGRDRRGVRRSSTSGGSTCTTPRNCSPNSLSAIRRCGTAWSIGGSKGSSTR